MILIIDNIEEITKEIIEEKDKLKLLYKQKLNDIMRHYGVELDIKHLGTEKISVIKFINLKFQNGINNLSVSYDNISMKYCFISYDFDNDKDLKLINYKKMISNLEKRYKLQLIVDECNRANNEYLKNLEDINIKLQYLKDNLN